MSRQNKICYTILHEVSMPFNEAIRQRLMSITPSIRTTLNSRTISLTLVLLAFAFWLRARGTSVRWADPGRQRSSTAEYYKRTIWDDISLMTLNLPCLLAIFLFFFVGIVWIIHASDHGALLWFIYFIHIRVLLFDWVWDVLVDLERRLTAKSYFCCIKKQW